jgi:protein SCO1/2
MTTCAPTTLSAIALCCSLASAVQAADAPSSADPDAVIRYSQAAIGRQLGNHALVADDGERIELAAYRGKPLIVNLVYTSCADVCPTVIQTLSRAVAAAQDALGADSFDVVTIGFDAVHDTPTRMAAFAGSQGIDQPNWRFLSADKETVEKLSEELGFAFYASPQGFDHAAQTTMIDRDGRIYRQVYGADFEIPAVVEPLKDLVFGRNSAITDFDGLVDRIRLFCTVFDPLRDRYRFSYAIFVSIIGGMLSLGAVGFVLLRAVIRLWRREARELAG